MNAIEMMDGAGFLNDRTRSARFPDSNYMKAINSAIRMIIDDRVDNIKKRKPYSVESVQMVRDTLYTLIPPTATIVPSGSIVAYPSDYDTLLLIQCTIDGVKSVARPTSYNEKALLPLNPFKKPSTTKPYFDQNAAGFNIQFGPTGSFTSADVDYMRPPAEVTIGKDTDKISSGGSVLTISTSYIVYEEAVHAGVTYVEGQTFVATATSLTSGIVIPLSVVVSCDLPVKIHEEVVRLASAVMNGTISDFFKKQDLKNDNQES